MSHHYLARPGLDRTPNLHITTGHQQASNEPCEPDLEMPTLLLGQSRYASGSMKLVVVTGIGQTSHIRRLRSPGPIAHRADHLGVIRVLNPVPTECRMIMTTARYFPTRLMLFGTSTHAHCVPQPSQLSPLAPIVPRLSRALIVSSKPESFAHSNPSKPIIKKAQHCSPCPSLHTKSTYPESIPVTLRSAKVNRSILIKSQKTEVYLMS